MTCMLTTDELRHVADALIAIFGDEEHAIASYDPPEQLAAIARTKRLVADRFCFLVDTIRSEADGLQDRPSVIAVLQDVQGAAEQNAQVVGRRLELLRGLIGAIEQEHARKGHRRVSRYTSGGALLSQGFAPVAVDSSI
ncbi:hypothetical protein [Sandaracinobacteroides saxicola]|uniref:Flagellar protein FlgN n=1 Tax=Sandaracinobacteroides saxicola TaxID=2759707 RepID=A0A7G5IK10_9SPHN|nr:hypothetical protein [Sandaracinobacteroides saxicola]QMW23702.1 hypothetical protein H3309_04215 [Sandaracinobacteroides saxicola]